MSYLNFSEAKNVLIFIPYVLHWLHRGWSTIWEWQNANRLALVWKIPSWTTSRQPKPLRRWLLLQGRWLLVTVYVLGMSFCPSWHKGVIPVWPHGNVWYWNEQTFILPPRILWRVKLDQYIKCHSPHLHREGNGTPLQYSCLENPMDRGAWWAAVYGVAQSWTRLKRLSSSRSCLYR